MNPNLPRESEKGFQQTVIDLAHTCGWVCGHFRKVRVQRRDGSCYWETPVGADGKGWPDLALAHERRGLLLFRELKVPPNALEPEQALWLRILAACGQDAKVWEPGDWAEIECVLKGEG